LTLDIGTNGLNELFTQIGLCNANGNVYHERHKKRDLLNDYLTIFKSIIKKLSSSRPLTFLDCGCGRSYLSFFLNHYFQNIGRSNVSFIGVDTNTDLVNKCHNTALKLNYSNMDFISSKILDYTPSQPLDIVYSLHACDIATDQTIMKGIQNNARYILSVSCCQYSLKKQIENHPLKSITKYSDYKEKLVDMISDSLRALLLEMNGYKVDIFEFTSTKNTPKNTMLRAEKVKYCEEKSYKAYIEYKTLSNMFHISPELELYLNQAHINKIYKNNTLR